MTTVRRSILTMPDHARVWIYKSAKPFTADQREAILARGHAFTTTWAAHGSALDACVDVLHDHLVAIAVDEGQAIASGCSIDKSVRLVQDLERDLGLVLTDRMTVLYLEGGAVRACRVQELEGMIASGILNEGTVMLDDLVGTVGDLRSRGQVPLRDTWMARYL